MTTDIVPCPETYKSAVKAFVVVNILFLIVGPCLICTVFILNNSHGQVEQVISMYTGDMQVPAYLLHLSSGLTTINGVLGLLSAYFDIPLLFDSYEGFTFVSLGLPLIAAVAASMVPTRFPSDRYQNLLQAEAYHLVQHPKFNTVCQDIHMWMDIQEVVGCCGVLGPRDWILSSLQLIPASCCKLNSPDYKKCKEMGQLHNNLTFRQIEAEIFPLLWNRNCMDGFQELLAKRKFIWTVFPLCLLLVKSFFMAYSALLVDFLRHYADYMSKRNLKQPLKVITEKLKKRQASLRIIKSTLSIDINLEETKELRTKFAGADDE